MLRENMLGRYGGIDLRKSGYVYREDIGDPATHKAETNVFFNPLAYLFVQRDLTPSQEFRNNVPAVIDEMTDPETGLTLRMIQFYTANPPMHFARIDMLYGVGLVDPRYVLKSVTQYPIA